MTLAPQACIPHIRICTPVHFFLGAPPTEAALKCDRPTGTFTHTTANSSIRGAPRALATASAEGACRTSETAWEAELAVPLVTARSGDSEARALLGLNDHDRVDARSCTKSDLRPQSVDTSSTSALRGRPTLRALHAQPKLLA